MGRIGAGHLTPCSARSCRRSPEACSSSSPLDPPTVAGLLLGMLAGITAHEFSHAFVADQLGDHRPRALGRVTAQSAPPPRPARHRAAPADRDRLGEAGSRRGRGAAARPDRHGVRCRRRDRSPTWSLRSSWPPSSGVSTWRGSTCPRRTSSSTWPRSRSTCCLALLNLIPIPPLDGFAILIAVVPPRWEYTFAATRATGSSCSCILLFILPNSPLSAVLGLARPWAAALCGI